VTCVANEMVSGAARAHVTPSYFGLQNLECFNKAQMLLADVSAIDMGRSDTVLISVVAIFPARHVLTRLVRKARTES
jgi:hypothetical protein